MDNTQKKKGTGKQKGTMGKKRQKTVEARRVLVSRYYTRGYSCERIRETLANDPVNPVRCTRQTVWKDVNFLLAEWRKERVENTDLATQLELTRIDRAISELWEQWDKSKEDYKKNSDKRKGKSLPGGEDEEGKLIVTEKEIREVEMRCLGDVSYISEIRAQEVERRKLLGLYMPEKKEFTGANGSPLSTTLNVTVLDAGVPLASSEEEVSDV
jgi:hypothetical protein